MPNRHELTATDSEIKAFSRLYEITENQARFLTALVDTGGNVSAAARITGLSKRQHYDALDLQKDNYRKAFRDCTQKLGQLAWLRLADRAINGDFIIYKGEIVRDPETGEPLRQYSDVAGIFVSKSGAGFSDQSTAEKQNSGPTVIINLPEQGKQQTIEINEADKN